MRPVPSGSVQHRKDRDARTRSYRAASSSHAAAFTHTDASAATRARYRERARANSSPSAPGSAVVASAMASTCAPDNSPARHAASVDGRSDSLATVATIARAAPTVSPVVADSQRRGVAVRTVALPCARRHHLSRREQLPSRGQSLHLAEQLDQRAHAVTVEPFGFRVRPPGAGPVRSRTAAVRTWHFPRNQLDPGNCHHATRTYVRNQHQNAEHENFSRCRSSSAPSSSSR